MSDGHTLRIAALALEMASRLRVPADQRQALEAAALLGRGAIRLQSARFDGLAAELGLRLASAAAGAPLTRLDPVASDILEVARYFSERMEYLPYERVTAPQIVDELFLMAEEGFCRPAVVTALAGLARIRREDLVERVRRLPVFPAVALRAIELASQPDAGPADLERLVSSDQVLAGRMVKAANSSLYSASRRISTIRQAVAYIGLDAARRILLASVFQPLFASQTLRELWKHSLEVAQIAERLARLANHLHPEEAFLAGLVHDVGRLAMERCGGEDVTTCVRLVEHGCEPVFAEVLLCGFDHGEGGAEILRAWSFPEQLVEAVEKHHQPEHTDSSLASLLYLAEFWSASEEDLPSGARLHNAQTRAGLPDKALGSLETKDKGLLEFLAAPI